MKPRAHRLPAIKRTVHARHAIYLPQEYDPCLQSRAFWVLYSRYRDLAA
jgi:hypothetical protein